MVHLFKCLKRRGAYQGERWKHRKLREGGGWQKKKGTSHLSSPPPQTPPLFSFFLPTILLCTSTSSYSNSFIFQMSPSRSSFFFPSLSPLSFFSLTSLYFHLLRTFFLLTPLLAHKGTERGGKARERNEEKCRKRGQKRGRGTICVLLPLWWGCTYKMLMSFQALTPARQKERGRGNKIKKVENADMEGLIKAKRGQRRRATGQAERKGSSRGTKGERMWGRKVGRGRREHTLITVLHHQANTRTFRWGRTAAQMWPVKTSHTHSSHDSLRWLSALQAVPWIRTSLGNICTTSQQKMFFCQILS